MHNWLSEMICHHFSIPICLAWLDFNEEWCTSSTTVNRVTKIQAEVEYNRDVWKNAFDPIWSDLNWFVGLISKGKSLKIQVIWDLEK